MIMTFDGDQKRMDDRIFEFEKQLFDAAKQYDDFDPSLEILQDKSSHGSAICSVRLIVKDCRDDENRLKREELIKVTYGFVNDFCRKEQIPRPTLSEYIAYDPKKNFYNSFSVTWHFIKGSKPYKYY